MTETSPDTLPLPAGLVATAPSGIRELANAALERPGAIRLDLGQPSFPTPPHVVEAAKAAIDAGRTSYTHTRGVASLREAVAAKLARVNGLEATVDEIACTPGGASAVAAALTTVVQPGDEVLVPDPSWPAFTVICTWLHATPVPYPCRAADGFVPDVEELERRVTPRTRALIVNSPNNPTGAAYPWATLEALADLALRRDLWLVSDECYDEIVFTDRGPSIASLLPPGRAIAVFSCSKTYAMTGWRLGYAVAHGEAIRCMEKVLESNAACASSISQAAAEAALRGPQDCVAAMVDAYRERRDLAVGILDAAGALCARPEGAFYAMADVSRSGLDARSFALTLLEREGVAVAPGTAFGEVARDAVRISLASSPDDIAEGLRRLTGLVDELEVAR